MKTFKRTLVTSALPYANGLIHFGHISGAYLPADIYVRYKRLKGEEVLFICGTDEYGTAIAVSAQQEGRTPLEQANHYHELIKKLFDRCSIEFDNFSRTTRPIHTKNAQKFFTDLHNAGYIEPKETEQWYSPTSKQFLADRQLVGKCYYPECGYEKARGDECPKCGRYLDALQLTDVHSMIDGSTLEKRKTVNWFLLLDKLQPELERWIDTHPEWKKNVLNKLKDTFREGLQSRPITRDLSWGVPIPLDDERTKNKCLYVWFDAPIGYVSSTQEWAEKQGKPDLWKEYWLSPESRLLHFIGKDNITFHALIFPAMLLKQSEPYVLPDNVPANEFLNLEGNKFNKSSGWTIDLEDFFSKYHPDALRYYLARSFPETADSDFLWKEFQAKVDELANIYGNLISRVFKFIEQFQDGKVPKPGAFEVVDETILKVIQQTPKQIGDEIEQFSFRQAAYLFLDLARQINIYYDYQKPWKAREEAPERCRTTLYVCVQAIKTLAIVGYPFIPETSQKVWTALNLKQKLTTLRDQVEQKWEEIDPIPAGHPISAVGILFKKIDEAQIAQEIDTLHKRKEVWLKAQQRYTPPPLKPQVTWDDFAKMDIRVGKVLQAEILPQSKNLLKLKIDIGLETRQVLAGIKAHYKPEDLIGKKVIFLANLAPKKIMGLESQGMVLAVDIEGKAILLQPGQEEVPEGAAIK
ncbi:MAG: methionine--tRNA ligase [Planctomycetota bacterium]